MAKSSIKTVKKGGKMYIAISKSSGKGYFFKEKKALSEQIGVSVWTIYRNVSKEASELNGYIVVEAAYVQEKSNRGGKRSTSWVKS